MRSIIDELLAKIAADSRVTARGGVRADLGMLLFAERESINALWKAADAAVRAGYPAGAGVEAKEAQANLAASVERLRPLFGERT